VLPGITWHTGDSATPPPLGFAAKTTYGLLALMELAGVEASGERLQVAEIASRQGIPERYLEQMMASLRRAGLLRSSRGPRGGYQLARPAAAISLAEVVECLEGDGEPNGDPGGNGISPELQVLQELSGSLRQQRLERLQRTSLAQLLEQRDALQQAQAMYFI
jgi:Rrf2 family protein